MRYFLYTFIAVLLCVEAVAMSFESEIRDSRTWVKEYELPLFPHTHNAFIYLAYYVKARDIKLSDFEFAIKVERFLHDHDAYPIKRYGTTIEPSHDEMIGAFYLAWKLGLHNYATHYLEYLNKTGWRIGNPLRENYENRSISRFVFMDSVAHSMCGFEPGLPSQLLYSLWVLAGAFSTDRGSGPYLMRWISFEPMEQFRIPGFAISVFKMMMAFRKKDLAMDLAIETGEPLFAELPLKY